LAIWPLRFADMVCAMPDASRSWSRPALVLVLYLALASAGVAWSGLRGDAGVWRLGGKEDPQTLAGIVIGVLLGLGFVFASRFATHRFEWGRALHRDLRDLLGPLPGPEIVVLAAASAVGEEIFFRGALLPAAGLWASSAIFALLHVGPKLRFLPWTVSSFVAGMVFGQLFLWSGDLGGPVVAHFTVNALNLRYLSKTDLR
jgi:membrane protease YdiL (CAAX protease family)